MYRSEIGNLGEMISTITKIVVEDENPLKLDDHGFVRYHGSHIRKLKILVNGRLQQNATSAVWRETAEFRLQPGEMQDYFTRKSSEDLVTELVSGPESGHWQMTSCTDMVKKRMMQPVRKTMITIPRAMKKTVTQHLAAGVIIIKCLTKNQRSGNTWKKLHPMGNKNRPCQSIKTGRG
jgi:hypothetical protein